jgi:TPR repeat protein
VERVVRGAIFAMLTLVVQHAAVAKDAVSQGLAYANGEGIRQDDKEAVKWFRLGARQGTRTRKLGLD